MLILSISIMGIDIENHSVFQKNKMIVIQLNDTRPSNRKRNKNKNKNKNKTITATRIGRQQRQKHQQQKEEKEDYSPRVKSFKDFVQLFEQKEKEGKNPRVYVSY
jgi:protein required for attachment to host cells